MILRSLLLTTWGKARKAIFPISALPRPPPMRRWLLPALQAQMQARYYGAGRAEDGTPVILPNSRLILKRTADGCRSGFRTVHLRERSGIACSHGIHQRLRRKKEFLLPNMMISGILMEVNFWMEYMKILTQEKARLKCGYSRTGVVMTGKRTRFLTAARTILRSLKKQQAMGGV